MQDGEDRPAAGQAGSPDQNKLQRRHSGELLPAGEDRHVGESPDMLYVCCCDRIKPGPWCILFSSFPLSASVHVCSECHDVMNLSSMF